VKKNAANSPPHRRKNLRIQQSIKQEVATSRRYDLQFKIERSGAIVSYAAKIKKMIRNGSYKISFEILYCREKCCDYAHM
jgi:anti-sigma28 factor (negative regulator of flagellin synthesis)